MDPAEQARVEYRAGKPVLPAPAVVLGRREDRIALTGGVDHRACGADGEAERLLRQDVAARPQQWCGDHVVARRVGDDVGRCDGGIVHDVLEPVVDHRAVAEQCLGLGRDRFGGFRPDVEHPGQRRVEQARIGEGGVTGEVPSPHPAAADQAHLWRRHRASMGHGH